MFSIENAIRHTYSDNFYREGRTRGEIVRIMRADCAESRFTLRKFLTGRRARSFARSIR